MKRKLRKNVLRGKKGQTETLNLLLRHTKAYAKKEKRTPLRLPFDADGANMLRDKQA